MRTRDAARLLNERATLRRSAGLDEAGNPTGHTDTVIACRVERHQRNVTTSMTSQASAAFGEQVLSDTTLVTNAEVLPTDAVILNGETRERVILAVESAAPPNRRGERLYAVAL